MNSKVDFFFDKAKSWKEEIHQLRIIAISTGLTEELKWGCPCYTYDGKNVVLIHTFKEYCAFLFFKGALLHDPKNILIQQTDNVQAARQIRFSSLDEIIKLEPDLKKYISNAVEVEKKGLKVELKKTKEYPVPDEFKKALDNDSTLKSAFESLTPGRQRGYLLHFSQAKQAKTREDRIEKYREHILNGKGLNDE